MMISKNIKVKIVEEEAHSFSVCYSLQILNTNMICSPEALIHYIAEEMNIPLGERKGMEFSICMEVEDEKNNNPNQT